MNYLLDTHIFLWYIQGHSDLSEIHRSLIEDINNDIYLSTISIWEIIIKAKLGKLKIMEPIYHYIQKSRDLHLINSLEFEEKNLIILESLPDIHKDPFDRLLICQAINNDIIFITNDSEIAKYPVKTL